MAVELILMNDVDDLGKIGETVRVADGYARNFLVPRGLARRATAGALRQLDAKKSRLRAAYEAERQAAQTLANKVQKHSVSIAVQASEDDKLYGSVTALQIAESLAQMGIEIDRRQIVLAEPIRQLGVYDVDVQLHADVTTTIKVWVVRA